MQTLIKYFHDLDNLDSLYNFDDLEDLVDPDDLDLLLNCNSMYLKLHTYIVFLISNVRCKFHFDYCWIVGRFTHKFFKMELASHIYLN